MDDEIIIHEDVYELRIVEEAYTVTILEESTEVTVTGGGEDLVEIVEERVEVISILEQGPPGPPGQDGNAAFLIGIAGSNLSGHRAVNPLGGVVEYADNVTAPEVSGITIAAAMQNSEIQIQPSGVLVEPSWSWVDGPIFLGLSGSLTQTPPVAGAITELGLALSPTSMLIRIQPPIFR